MTDNLIAFALGFAAGSGWLMAVILTLATRRLRERERFILKANHDLHLMLVAERQMRVEAVAAAVAAGVHDPLGACAQKCAEALLGKKPHPGAN